MKREIEVEITPQEAANAFTEFDHEQQAEFFSAVGKISREWGGAGWCQQASWIVPALDDDGKRTVESLADHFASHFKWEPSK